MMKTKIFNIFLLFLVANSVNAQFGRILDRAADKISDRVTDKIVEVVAEEIARAAMKPIDKAIDDMMRERYVQDSINGNTQGRDYSAFLKTFTVDVDLPEHYAFDMSLDVETTDYDKNKESMVMMLTKSGDHIGIVQEKEQEFGMMVLDIKNDIVAMYSEKDGEKKVMAMPSMISLASAMVESEQSDISVEKTGKTKKILGYECDEYKIEDESNNTKAYVANGFPVLWKESFGAMMEQVVPTTTRDKMPDGMVLKSETKTKKKNKKSKYEVKKIHETPSSIVNTDYQKTNYNAEEE